MGGRTARYCCGGIWPHVWREDGNHNWDAVENIIEPYLPHGITVVLDFSHVPQWLWADPGDPDLNQQSAPEWVNFLSFIKIGSVKPPVNYTAWEALIRETVHHLNVVKKYGIIFEVWNEGDNAWRELGLWLEQPPSLGRFRVELLMKLRYGESAGIDTMKSHIEQYREINLTEIDECEQLLTDILGTGTGLTDQIRALTITYLKSFKESIITWCDDSLDALSRWEEENRSRRA